MSNRKSFRNRKIDNKKPIRIYLEDEITDLDELTGVARSVPVIETGVDKDEEEVRKFLLLYSYSIITPRSFLIQQLQNIWNSNQ